jgi:DNA-binding transcriptional ArsR family regulator
MTTGFRDQPIDGETRAARAIAHPVRADVLRHLADGPASPSELARTLGEPLTTVSYHVRILSHLGFLELLETVPRRGTLEHRYRATARVTMIVEQLENGSAAR